MVNFVQTKIAKEKFHVVKRPINNWDVNDVDKIIISKLVKTITNSKYLSEYLDKV